MRCLSFAVVLSFLLIFGPAQGLAAGSVVPYGGATQNNEEAAKPLDDRFRSLFGSYYEVLGVSPSASQDEIHQAFRLRAKKVHPDLHPENPSAKTEFQDLQTAYDTLKDPESRAAYDRNITRPQDAEKLKAAFLAMPEKERLAYLEFLVLEDSGIKTVELLVKALADEAKTSVEAFRALGLIFRYEHRLHTRSETVNRIEALLAMAKANPFRAEVSEYYREVVKEAFRKTRKGKFGSDVGYMAGEVIAAYFKDQSIDPETFDHFFPLMAKKMFKSHSVAWSEIPFEFQRLHQAHAGFLQKMLKVYGHAIDLLAQGQSDGSFRIFDLTNGLIAIGEVNPELYPQIFQAVSRSQSVLMEFGSSLLLQAEGSKSALTAFEAFWTRHLSPEERVAFAKVMKDHFELRSVNHRKRSPEERRKLKDFIASIREITQRGRALMCFDLFAGR